MKKKNKNEYAKNDKIYYENEMKIWNNYNPEYIMNKNTLVKKQQKTQISMNLHFYQKYL